MSGNESAAEELVELGIELVNPGGRPDVLRDAAKAWRKLQKDLAGDEGILKALERDVENTVGNTWRGEAADAFKLHFQEFKSAVADSVDEFDEVADGLDEAADAIEKCNDEIHQIYLEIGVTAAVGVATSFFSFGLTGAAAAANITRLAAQAVRIAGRLGTLLQRIAAIFRRLSSLNKVQSTLKGLKGLKDFVKSSKHLTNLAVNAGANTAGNVVATAVANGGRMSPKDFADAAWQGVAASAFGTGIGIKIGGMVSKPGLSAVTEGVVGNVAGGAGVDLIKYGSGQDLSVRDWAYNALGNTIGGVAGGGMTHGANQLSGPRSSDNPHMAFEGILGGVALGTGGVAKDKIRALEEDFG
ncbi:WXG100 family type VII secretion target [Streptomyces sp. DSM 42041]|uniref:WXG100 family type VII secretion target n=1 Tax=Streptomyces hazeniae TaxID=3075538 RepID=A0ABU2NVJ7_9ACTN|nr:WXG100 family type VII secretion target [Streptomyces sp. DSM 42041]MDT0381009.1 WXG100 family type VII secretion target [Streptomyces sp. DSM 42041]